MEEEGGMRDGWDWSAPMHAAEKGHIECIKLLLEKEAGMRDDRSWTALMQAAQGGHTECVRLLAERERDMKTTHKWNWFPPGTAALDIAEKTGRTAIASILSG